MCGRYTPGRGSAREGANVFGQSIGGVEDEAAGMQAADQYVAAAGAPTDRAVETLEASDLPPPQPLQNTLQRLAGLDDDVVLVQRNDRAPQHLYPKLDDRGYEYETLETDSAVVTVVWSP